MALALPTPSQASLPIRAGQLVPCAADVHSFSIEGRREVVLMGAVGDGVEKGVASLAHLSLQDSYQQFA